MPPERQDEDRDLREGGAVQVDNPHLLQMESDFLYHLGLGTATHDLKEMFGDVKFVCTGGTSKRMESLSRMLLNALHVKLPSNTNLRDMTLHGHRFSMYKVGPVLAVNHGMGKDSTSILMYEMLKLLHHARCTGVTFLRLGTSGGIGVKPGSIVISTEVLNGLLKPELNMFVFCERVLKPALLDQSLAMEIHRIAGRHFHDFDIFTGKTLSTDDFYEGQARLNGAMCSYSEEESKAFIQKIANLGVLNIEMESLQFAAACYRANVKGAVICVTCSDRLQEDVVNPTEKDPSFENRPLDIAVVFIKHKLGLL